MMVFYRFVSFHIPYVTIRKICQFMNVAIRLNVAKQLVQ